MAVLRSRLLARLDAAIGAARNPIELACLRAERAAFLARHGRRAEAQRVLDDLQAQFLLHPQPAVSAWLNLVDGLLDYFGTLTPTDKMARAHALSVAAGLKPLQALSAAWMAQMAFARRDDEAVARHAGEALGLAAGDDHSTGSRVCLVVADAYHVAGRYDLALPWYARTREHALADGDDAAISALIHNQAWMRCANARLHEAFVGGAADVGRQAVIGAESSEHFDAGIGARSLASSHKMLQAAGLLLEHRCAEALALYEGHLAAAMADGLGRLRPWFVADMAWCALQLGRRDDARHWADDALATIDVAVQIDDRAIARAQLARVYRALGDPARADEQRALALEDLRAHRAESERLVALIDAATAPHAA